MNLEKFIKQINEVDEYLTIYLKGKLSIDSEVFLYHNQDHKIDPIMKDDEQYLYLIEVFIAKDFIDDYVNSFFNPNDEKLAQRLLDYAINDA